MADTTGTAPTEESATTATSSRPPLDFMTYEQWFDEAVDSSNLYTHHLKTREEHPLGTLDPSSTEQAPLKLPKLQKPALKLPASKYPISSRLLHDNAAVTKRGGKTFKERKREFLSKIVRPGCALKTASWVDDMLVDDRLFWLKPEPRQTFELNYEGLGIQDIYHIADLGHDQPGADDEDGGKEVKERIPAINQKRWDLKVASQHKCSAHLHNIIDGEFFKTAMEELDRAEGRDGLCECPWHLG